MLFFEFALIKQLTYPPVHFIRCTDDSAGGIASCGFNNCDSLSQYFIIF